MCLGVDWVKQVADGVRPPIPPEVSLPCKELMEKCWATDSDSRLTAEQALKLIDSTGNEECKFSYLSLSRI